MVACTVCRLKRGLAGEEGFDTPMHIIAGCWENPLTASVFSVQVDDPCQYRSITFRVGSRGCQEDFIYSASKSKIKCIE